MFDRWFSKRRAEPCAIAMPAPDDRLMSAQERIAELEAMLQSTVVELDRYRELATTKSAKAAAKPKAVKPAKLSALEFWAVHTVAVDKIRAEYGDNWKVAAPFGKTELVTLASSLRNYTTERGTKLKWPKDQRFPAAAYWPGGAFPEGVTANGDYSRVDPQLKSASGPATPISHNAVWHLDHGYVLLNGDWVFELQARAQLAHQKATAANAEAKAAAELAEVDAEMDLAEAAD